jgi:hypothetical protein
MEQLTETITLDMEEANELAFKIQVEGASSPAKVRLVCESGDVSYMFNGKGTSEDGVVQFVIPQMKEKLSEGTYSAKVEVLIENRYFSPVQFQINFKKAMKVFAESIQVKPIMSKPEIKVTASALPVAVQQKNEPKPIVVEQSRQTSDEQNEIKEALSLVNTLKQKYASLIEKQQNVHNADPVKVNKSVSTLAQKFKKNM